MEGKNALTKAEARGPFSPLFFTFSKPLQVFFFKMEISTGKRLKSRLEKIRKSDFAPLEKLPCFAPVHER